MSALVAVTSLFLTLASLAVPGGALLAPFLFGLFVLALIGVFSGLEDPTVRQDDVVLEPRRWRDGS